MIEEINLPSQPLPQTKHCPRCNTPKARDEFGISHGRKDGRNIYCKACNRDRTNKSRAEARERRALRIQTKHNRGVAIPQPEPQPEPAQPPQGKLTNEERVLGAIRKGFTTYPAIQASTGIYSDELGIALAELISHQKKVGSISRGDERVYYLK